MIAGVGDQLFLGGSSARVNEQANALMVHVSSARSALEILNFKTNADARIDLMGGVGGYKTSAEVLGSLHEDASGNAVLSLGGTGYIQFDHTSVVDLTTHNFIFS